MSRVIKTSCITILLISILFILLPLTAFSAGEFGINGTCSLNGVPSQSITITGPYGSQTTSFPGGTYSMYIRVPEGMPNLVTITASAKGYMSQSRDIDLNTTTSLDFNLVTAPTIFTVSGICFANGTPAEGIAVYDDTYGERVVTDTSGRYIINISVPYGGSTTVNLIASRDGYEQEARPVDLNTTSSVDFHIYPVPIATVVPSVSAGPNATPSPTTAANQSATGIQDMISAHLVWIIAAIIVLVAAVGAVVYLTKRRGKGGNKPHEPSREDIYKLVTGEPRRRRRPNDRENDGKGHEKLK